MSTQVAVLIAWIVLVGVSPLAHHSFAAEFDEATPLKLTGVVTKVDWVNPHTFFYVDVRDETSGKVINWAMEMGTPNGLMRAGWTRNTLKIGDKVTVEGSLARDGSPLGHTRVVVLAETGQRLFAASNQAQQP
jgi:hypothetical protein